MPQPCKGDICEKCASFIIVQIRSPVMDPLTATASVISVLGVCLKVSVELKKFRNAVNEGRATVTAMLADVTSLRQVLQTMEDTFDELDPRSMSTGSIGMHWRSLLISLQDGHTAIKRLEHVVQSCNTDVAFMNATRRHIRLKMAAEEIAEFRQQIQSYKDTLQLSLQTIILYAHHLRSKKFRQLKPKYRCKSCSIHESTTRILPNLQLMHDDIRRLATNLDVKLQAMQEASVASKQDNQIDSINNLKQTVRSAATVLSSTSTAASLDDQRKSQEIDDVSSETGNGVAIESTTSWIKLQGKYKHHIEADDDWPLKTTSALDGILCANDTFTPESVAGKAADLSPDNR